MYLYISALMTKAKNKNNKKLKIFFHFDLNIKFDKFFFFNLNYKTTIFLNFRNPLNLRY